MGATRRFVPVTEWENDRQLLGVEGERLAIAYLTSCGWCIEAHRFRLGRHEIDLVVRKERTVAFVEVKTRRSASCGSGLEAVSQRKQRDITRVARAWLLRHGRPDDEYRFDLIAIEARSGGEAGIDYIADAWRPLIEWIL